MPQLRFRMATREDTPEIVALMNGTFRTPIDPSTWEWYVYGNPLGPSRVYLALEADRDTIAGAIGFAPINLRIGGTRVMGDYAHHLALKPVYRDTMSYIALLRHSLTAQAAGPTMFAIGPPNRTAYPIHKALMKWADFGYLDCMRKLAPSQQKHTCQERRHFFGEFDAFYHRVSKSLNFCVEKTTTWMNWRFCQRPGSPYTVYTVLNSQELAGYIVLKRWHEPSGYRKAHILDLHALNTSTLSNLIAAAETYAADCHELNLWAVQGYAYRQALEGMGFTVSGRQPLLARAYDGSLIVYPDGPCSLTYGDGDTVF